MIRKNTPYVAPKAKPFSGQGYRLGSIVPNVVGGGGLSETLELVELEKPSDEGKQSRLCIFVPLDFF